MTWTTDSSGTQTAAVNTEHTLDSPTTNGTYILSVSLVNMTGTDAVELRAYDKIDGTNFALLWKATFQAGLFLCPGIKFPPVDISAGGKFTLKQIAGTGRDFPWAVRRI